ncbi:zinc ribbon domain-containing protein [Pseudonocardia xinjiangensis]|uniref:Zinc ribbon domain-containing protein n=1 Tax=Pseudonocardia xinjiangensis TaxID=75289 RepID=A0ABX1RLC3_9PSEU|nr:zinc ribbon domain-containing protein [Pseudonocardia xinjiangensis]NMH81192.1 zinc ribbon domain-containing protein [Pseudonocardia xinjiangensis]
MCGDFVDWDEVRRTEQRASQAARPAAQPQPAPQPQSQPAPQPPAAAPAPAPYPPQAPVASRTAGFDDTPADPDAESRKSDLRQRARRLLVPLSERDEVAPVLPGRPEPPRPEVRQVTATQESGIVCWNCGVENRSDRRFCRNCGVDLSAAPAPAAPRRPGFWKRIRLWFARLSRGKLIALAALIAAAILAALAFLFLPALINKFSLLTPSTVAASETDQQHPPTAAFDGNSSSWWGTGQSGDSSGAAITANYAQSVNLRAVRITPGVSPDPKDRDKENRPELLDITVENTQGQNKVFHVRLQDDLVQQVDTPVDNVKSVTLTVRSAYQSGRDKQVAIAEVQLLGTRS